MDIEVKERGSKAFYEEVVSVMAQYNRLLRKPEAKLTDSFRSYRIQLILLAVLFLINTLLGIYSGFDTLTILGMVLVSFAAFIIVIYMRRMRKLVDSYLADERTSIVTLDESGVEIRKGNSQMFRLAWEEVAFVRSFREATCFLARDVTGLVISVTNKYKQEIMDYISSHDIKVRVIDL